MIDYAGRLKKIRLKMDLKQTEVAAAAGLSLRTYQRYEYGQRQPTADVLVALANFYDVSIDYLVGRTNNPNMNR
ncbi:MAG TPA: XRE family transcriptional regulator [Clostridiales bacterium]|jgi:transcriptional regulator with XRE-family HTH domain|uniref:Helix-turn-helix transcriptional regulator n=1 Tax=Congzhengia minquanensis TaxID=2763657 RepID=A0A926DLI8_9FIRM|nr:helix-turn-helix transcriptional regulator [Congzhengia minquanensis]MBC8539932.1 helix-turn-helix transcriptional regulator [Congzhengia minquanensis]MBD8946812.1 XRE family transcriptional regulator [Clostridiales bacterium]HBL82972.1 XRE family transcriptional regulator [Clostridiales bacterium]